MESGAKGCEVVVSGKLRAARAKSMKFTVRLSQGKKKIAPDESIRENQFWGRILWLIQVTGRFHDPLRSARQGVH